MRESRIDCPCEIRARPESNEYAPANGSPSESLPVELNEHELSKEQQQFAEVLGQSLAEMWRQESEANAAHTD